MVAIVTKGAEKRGWVRGRSTLVRRPEYTEKYAELTEQEEYNAQPDSLKKV